MMTCECNYENHRVIGLCRAHQQCFDDAIKVTRVTQQFEDIKKLLSAHGYESVTGLLARTEQYRVTLERVITQRNRLDTALFKSNVTLWLEATKD